LDTTIRSLAVAIAAFVLVGAAGTAFEITAQEVTTAISDTLPFSERVADTWSGTYDSGKYRGGLTLILTNRSGELAGTIAATKTRSMNDQRPLIGLRVDGEELSFTTIGSTGKRATTTLTLSGNGDKLEGWTLYKYTRYRYEFRRAE